jgi:hypothetical protein
MLIVLRDNPKVRLLFTLAEGLYRIVAKRSAGIRASATAADYQDRTRPCPVVIKSVGVR